MRSERSMKYVVVAALLAFSFFLSVASVKAAPADPGAEKYRESEQRVYTQFAVPWWMVSQSGGYTSLKGAAAHENRSLYWDSPQERATIQSEFRSGLNLNFKGISDNRGF